MPHHPMTAHKAVALVAGHTLPLQFGTDTAHLVGRTLPRLLEAVGRHAGQQRVERQYLHTFQAGTVGFVQLRHGIPAKLHVLIETVPHAVEGMVHRVDAKLYFPHILGLRHIAQHFLVHKREVAVKVHDDFLITESLAVIRQLQITHRRGAATLLKCLRLRSVP